MKKILFLSALLVLLFRCDKPDPDPKPKAYFELTVGSEFVELTNEYWIILQNKDGELLDARQFGAGDHLVFDTVGNIGDEIGVTIFSASPTTNSVTFFGESFLGVPINSSWTMPRDPYPTDGGSVTGEINVTVTGDNMANTPNTYLSTRYDGIGSGEFLGESEIGFLTNVYSNMNDFFVFAADADGNPFYKFMENANPGDYTIPFADFESFDHIVEITLLPTNSSFAYVRGFETGQSPAPGHGYYTNFYFDAMNGATVSSYKLGYLDRFEKYLTIVWADYPDYSVGYSVLGPRLASNFELLKVDEITVTNKTFSGYAVSGEAFDHYESSWTTGGFVGDKYYLTSWRNAGRDTGFHYLRKIPTDIAAKYPNINFDGMTHSRSVFNKGTSFESLIATRFGNGPVIESYEQVSLTVK